jgi:hypothetical protein
MYNAVGDVQLLTVTSFPAMYTSTYQLKKKALYIHPILCHSFTWLTRPRGGRISENISIIQKRVGEGEKQMVNLM